MAADITLDELLAEFGRFAATADGRGMTVRELCQRSGLTEESVRVRLRRAQDAGVLRAGKKAVEKLGGGTVLVPCYWVERPKAGKKGR